MIRTLATALLALSLTVSGAFATSWDDLVRTDGLYHKKFTDVPFTGEVDEGKFQGAMKNGKHEGPWVEYTAYGKVKWKGAYKNGELEGAMIQYFPNGGLHFKGAWKNGEQEGPWVVYRENGLKDWKVSGTYRNGEKVPD